MIPALRRPALSWLLIAAISLWLRSFFPVHAIGTAIMDDALFIRGARSILAGDWLGPFDNLTLVKGAFYPLFIAAAFIAGIPLKIAEQIVYLAASALVATRAPSRTTRLALFAALAFIPVLWAAELARVIREGLYISLSLAIIGAATTIATAPTRRAAAWRGLGLGLLAGAFWLTREEGVWLLPALVVVLALGASRIGWRHMLPPVTAAVLGWALLVGANIAYNWSSYRVATTVEVRSAAFRHAYGALSRIEHAQWRHYDVFPADARALAFRVSPAARELLPFFDSPTAEAWRQIGCRELPGHECGEILAPWFQWAFRDAVAQAGHYSTAREAQRYYRTLAREIDAACDARQIPCLPPRATLAPPFRWSSLIDAIRPAFTLLGMAATLGGTQVDSTPSIGTTPEIDAFADIVGPVARHPVDLMELLVRLNPHGSDSPSLRIQPIPGPAIPAWTTSLTRDPADVVTLSTDCPIAACALVIAAAGHDVATLPLASLPAHLDTPDASFDLLRIRLLSLHHDTWLRDRIGLKPARAIGALYSVLGPILLLTGLTGLALTALRRRDLVRTPLFALATGSLVAIVSRIALLAYVHVTGIPSVNLLYLSPAIPFVAVLALTGTTLLLTHRRPTTP